MKFFVDEEKRKASHSTCYFEFQKGYYHGKCWLPDSINISDSLWNEYHLSDLIACVIKNVDYYGTTIVTKNQCFFPVSSVRYPSSFSTCSAKSAFVLLRIAARSSSAASVLLSFMWLVSFIRYFSR